MFVTLARLPSSSWVSPFASRIVRNTLPILREDIKTKAKDRWVTAMALAQEPDRRWRLQFTSLG
jgi:hypothetical protein